MPTPFLRDGLLSNERNRQQMDGSRLGSDLDMLARAAATSIDSKSSIIVEDGRLCRRSGACKGQETQGARDAPTWLGGLDFASCHWPTSARTEIQDFKCCGAACASPCSHPCVACHHQPPSPRTSTALATWRPPRTRRLRQSFPRARRSLLATAAVPAAVAWAAVCVVCRVGTAIYLDLAGR